MKIRVDLDKLIDCVRIVVTVIDSESTYSHNLFRSPLDYPSDEMWYFVEDKYNLNFIEFITSTEEKARFWADREIKCLKDKLHI